MWRFLCNVAVNVSFPCVIQTVQMTKIHPVMHSVSTFCPLLSPPAQVKSGECLHTCSLRPTGIYGEGHELMKDFYKQGVQRGGLIIGGVPDYTEHGRVYAGEV